MKQGLDRFKGMTWARAKDELQRNAHMLVLDNKDERCVEIVQTYRNYGMNAGMGALVAHLFMKEHGAGNAAVRATEIYTDITNKIKAKGLVPEKVRTLRCKLDNLEYCIWFAARGSPKPREWPLKPRWRKLDHLGGLANVMMFLAMRELNRDETTTSQIAAWAIARFLREGFEGKKRKETA
jgi:hypothetical protein